MQSNGVCERVCVCRHISSFFLMSLCQWQVPLCACCILLVMVNIFLMPPLPGAAGCLGVSRKWKEDYADLCCVPSVQSLSSHCRACSVEPSPPSHANGTEPGGDASALWIFLMYIIKGHVFRDGGFGTDLIDDMAVQLGFSMRSPGW